MALDVPTGTTVFVDANILHYALIPTTPFSEHVFALMDRLSAGDVTGVVTLQVLADVQQTMMSLLAAQFQLSRSQLVGWAKKHPAELCELTGLTEAIQLLRSAGITTLADRYRRSG